MEGKKIQEKHDKGTCLSQKGKKGNNWDQIAINAQEHRL